MCLYVEKARGVPELTQMESRGDFGIGRMAGDCLIGTWGVCSKIEYFNLCSTLTNITYESLGSITS